MKYRSHFLIYLFFLIVPQMGFSQSKKEINLNEQKRQIKDFEYSFEARFPYKNIMRKINRPDTLIYYECVLRTSMERNEKLPVTLLLFIYKKNNLWWGTSILKYRKYTYFCGKRTYHITYKQAQPMCISRGILDKNIDDMINELNQVDYSSIWSDIHTSVFVKLGQQKYSAEISAGTIRNCFFEAMPETSYIFSVAYFETLNTTIIRKYKSIESYRYGKNRTIHRLRNEL
ncbi:MAG: hypothetical protein K6F29_07240 [Bacteroidales bacterium]|nr:hypothetical protein [Bacteroidales bacterium]